MSQVTVGISDLKVVKNPDSLVTYALGSCVGICLFDSVAKVAGMSHIMLPSINDSSQDKNVMKFADSAAVELVKQMERQGALKSRLVAKIAGGAQMFKIADANPTSNFGSIGRRNVEAVKKILATLNIRIIAEDTGADYGRTIYFHATDGSLIVKSLTKGQITL